METIKAKLEEAKGQVVMIWTQFGSLEGKVHEVTADTVTLELQANTERQAFSGGNDLKRITKLHCTIVLDRIARLDQMATA